MIDVENKVKVYETDGQETKGLNYPLLIVKNHWNRDSLVVLQIGEGGKCLSVCADDLKKAIENATNTKRF